MGKNRNTKKNTIQKANTRYQALYMVPILLLALVYPFLAQQNNIPNPLRDMASYFQTDVIFDSFLFIRFKWLIFIMISMIGIILFSGIINKNTCKTTLRDYKYFIPLGIYGIFIILSTIFAQNRNLALSGMPGEMENMWTLFAYLTTCIFGYWYLTTVEKKHSLIYISLSGTFAMGIVFLLQFMGMDPFLALLEKYNAVLVMDGIYGGFYNPNYLGSYAVLVLPLLATLLITFRKNKPLSILIIVNLALTLFGLMGSKSSGGIIGLVAIIGFVFLFIVFKKLHLTANTFFVTTTILIIAAGTVATGFISHASETGQFLYSPLEAIYTCDDRLSIHYNGNIYDLKVNYTDTDFQVNCTSNGTKVDAISTANDSYIYQHFAVRPITLPEVNDKNVFGITYNTTTWFFTNDTIDGTYHYITTTGNLAQNTTDRIWELPILHKDLEAIYTYDDYLEIHYDNEVYFLTTEYSDTYFHVTCMTEYNEIIKPTLVNNAYIYPFFTIVPYRLSNQDNIIAFELTYGKNSWFYTNDTADGTYYVITASEGFDKITAENTSSGILLSNLPRFLTGRGYIWSYAIPMLQDTLFIGYGPDNFAIHFPNHDFIEALRSGFSSTYISKPHNMYLQIAIQTGLPSLLSFFAFYLLYFVQSIKIYFVTTLNTKHSLIGFGIFLGTIGYLIVGLVNDSTITVAPFFWLLFGMGYAMNRICSNE